MLATFYGLGFSRQIRLGPLTPIAKTRTGASSIAMGEGEEKLRFGNPTKELGMLASLEF